MKIAYLVLAHNNMKHLERLIEALNDDEVSFFIHIDKKVHLPVLLRRYSNVKILENRFDVKWMGYSMVEATLSLLETAYNFNGCYDYFILLSGVDYPIKSNQYIKSFFAENNGKSFINTVKMPGNGKTFNRLDYYYIEGGSRRSSIIKLLSIGAVNMLIRCFHLKRKFPKEYSHYVMYGGSSWWAFHKTFVSYALGYYKNNPVFFDFYKHTSCPDEMIFQTIIMNSPFKETVTNGLTYHDWKIGQPPYPSLIDNIHLPILRQELIDASYGASKHLFARKFNDESARILNEIEKIRSTPGF